MCFLYINTCVFQIPPDLFFGNSTFYFPGIADNQGIIWDLHILRHQCSSTDDAVFPDLTAVHQNGSHTNHGIVADLTAVDDRTVSNGHMISDLHRISTAQMHYRIVLNIALSADDNGVPVAPDHRIVPYSAVFSDRHISKHHRTVCKMLRAFGDAFLLMNVVLILSMVTTVISIGILIAAKGAAG